jgi:hypothetical protein
MKAAIIQSNYLPWKGYFDIINEVDLFIFEDDLQFTVRDWRNRNRFKTCTGTHWLTVPVKGGRSQAIDEVCISYDTNWVRKHLETLRRAYGAAPCFSECFDLIDEPLQANIKKLSSLNQLLIIKIARYLGSTTRFCNARDFTAEGAKDDRLIDLCKKTGATEYLTGPAARSYIVPEKFEKAGIKLHWKDYAGYPEYPHHRLPFEHQVSILDCIFETGKKAGMWIWGWRTNRLQSDTP